MGLPMRLKLVTPPGIAPISLADAKAHAHVDHTDEDAIIGEMISAAVAKVDGAGGELGRALVHQTWEMYLDGFPTGCGKRQIVLPLPPLEAVDSINYVDQAGNTRLLGTDVYDVNGQGGATKASIVEAYGQSWPATRRRTARVR